MLHQRFARAFPLGLLSISLCFLATGCGGDKGYRISGKVTFKGQPVASGKIYFVPDTSKGNKGASGYADIKDGAYDTASTGRGSVGGPMLVKIDATDPGSVKTNKSGETEGKALFPTYQIAVDLPKEVTTKDFDVPAEALKGMQGKAGIIP